MNSNIIESDDSSAEADIWDRKSLEENVHAALESKYSDMMNDDFFELDGLEIEDDFNGLLDIPPAGATFGDLEDEPKTKEDRSQAGKDPRGHSETHHAEAKVSGRKRSLDDGPRLVTPPAPKKRRPIETADFINSPPSSCSSTRSVRTLSSLESSSTLHSDPYKRALQQLARSMQRSEMTRNEIIRQRKMAETQARLRAAQAKNLANADRFVYGSRSTLTVGLEQSRHMLRSYMTQMKDNMF